MNSFSTFLGPQYKTSIRIAAAIYLFISTVILQGLFLLVVVLAARQLIHLGLDLPIVINLGLIVCLVLFGWVIEKLPEQTIFSPRQYIAPPLVGYASSSFYLPVSFVAAPPFIPPRHNSFAH